MELFHVSDATVFMKHGKNHPIDVVVCVTVSLMGVLGT